MSAEIQFDHDSGKTCYAQLRNVAGQIWNGSAFEAYNASNIANYDIAATEQGASGLYVADMPAVTAGVYNIVAKEQAGGSPAQSDKTVGVGSLDWTGTAVSDTLAVAGLNKSAKSIVTGVVGTGSTTSSIVTSSLSPAATRVDQFKARVVIFDANTTSAALRGQGTTILGNDASGVLSVNALTDAPANGDVFTIV